MGELQNLFGSSEHPQCGDCSILSQDKAFHCGLDYGKSMEPHDILFLSESFISMYGEPTPFSDKGFNLLQKILPKEMGYSITYSAAVKCPGVKEADMSPDNMNICREHLYQTLLSVRPKLVFACGNLALKMLTKKSGIMNKRGAFLQLAKEFECEEFESVVVPIYHPTLVINEPSLRYLFELDINHKNYKKYKRKG